MKILYIFALVAATTFALSTNEIQRTIGQNIQLHRQLIETVNRAGIDIPVWDDKDPEILAMSPAERADAKK